jgi:hypothetical protein
MIRDGGVPKSWATWRREKSLRTRDSNSDPSKDGVYEKFILFGIVVHART